MRDRFFRVAPVGVAPVSNRCARRPTADHPRRYDLGAMHPRTPIRSPHQPRALSPLPHPTTPPRSLQAMTCRLAIVARITTLPSFDIRHPAFARTKKRWRNEAKNPTSRYRKRGSRPKTNPKPTHLAPQRSQKKRSPAGSIWRTSRAHGDGHVDSADPTYVSPRAMTRRWISLVPS